MEDESWRIKYMVCDKIAEIGSILDKKTIKEFLLPYYLKFCVDFESEVQIIFFFLKKFS